MPSLLAEEPGVAAALVNPSALKDRIRKSEDSRGEDRKRSTDLQHDSVQEAEDIGDVNGSVAKENRKLNGELPNGIGRSPSEMVNGVTGLDGNRSSREDGDDTRRSLQSSSSRLSQNLDQRAQTGEVPIVNGRPVTRDDGAFASVASGTERPGWPSKTTKVALTASLQGNTTSPAEQSPKASLDKSTGQGPADGSLRVPTSVHRASSPPAFNQSSQSAAPTSATNLHPQPPKLQQRHTLEVPRVSTSRMSREIPSAQAEDVVSASGRFSPNTPTRRRGSINLVRRATRSIHSELHLDELPPDDDAARWAEHIRQKRASKRKWRDDEDEDRVVVGTKVDQNHVNYVTMYNMLTGIRFTVSRTNAKMDRDLTDADFDAKHKFSFDVTGNELTPSAKYDFKFKDYAPWVFRHLRSNFKLDPADYLMSLTSKYILSELGSPGKSGSFFYFSRDYKYIIKTIHHAEHKFLRKVLRDYYNHVKDNPNTLLSQFYGLHRVKIPYGRKIHFVVMNNLFPPHRDIHRTFDLKGSTIGRDFREEDLESNPRATLKDLNWLRRNLHLEFGPTKKRAFIEQMERDVALLERLKIMDYSLLVGIHDLDRGNEERLRDKNLKVFQPGGDEGDSEDPMRTNALLRTPSKLESARKAKELRGNLRISKPVPMEQASSKMPEEWEWKGEDERKNFYFYADDGGFRATHEDDRPGEEIYYLGIIDCLTHYGFIKRVEHFWKGLSNSESQISAVPPERYGDRFVKFITGVTKTREAAELEKAEQTGDGQTAMEILNDPRLSGVNMHPGSSQSPTDPPGTNSVIEKAEKQAEKSKRHGADESNVPNKKLTSARSPSAERGDPGGYTLPVVEEDVEGQSTGGRSGRSGRSNEPSPHPSQQQQNTGDSGLGSPPQLPQPEVGTSLTSKPLPTPSKDDWSRPISSMTATEDGPHTPVLNNQPGPQFDGAHDLQTDSPPQTLLKDKVIRKRASDLNKALPMPPVEADDARSDFMMRPPDAS